jgi:hypothetical protein
MQISPARDIAPLVVAPLLALVSFGLLHWKGIGLNPDGWAMWQRDYRSGPPIETPAGLLVAPISFDGRCDTQTSRCR